MARQEGPVTREAIENYIARKQLDAASPVSVMQTSEAGGQ
jgi:hypothetical protein